MENQGSNMGEGESMSPNTVCAQSDCGFKTYLRWIVPIALVTFPWWLGFPLLYVGSLINSHILVTPGIYIAGILPQYTTFPYYSYYTLGGGDRFPLWWVSTIIHWLVVLAIYGWLIRGRSFLRSIFIFLALAVASLLLVQDRKSTRLNSRHLP